MDHYRETNLQNWEARVPVHLAGDTYGMQSLAADPTALSGVVAFDADRLGDLTGFRALHLQCHIGTDTLSLARLGASITGLDFSPAAVAAARQLCEQAGVPARFVVADVYEAGEVLAGERFDLVYTGVGALCWLPDIVGWARVVAGLLEPGGRLFVRELHPVLFTLDDERDDEVLVIRHPYFNTAEPQFSDKPTSYGSAAAHLPAPERYVWNHGLGEVVTGLLGAGLRITGLVEHEEGEWQALPWMVPTASGRFALPAGRDRVPMMYTLTAAKDR